MKSVFVVPIYNQVLELPRLLEEFKSTDLPCDTLLLINNGCTDGSAELIRKSGFPTIELPRNLGVGHGFIRSTEWALERGYDVFGQMAGNGKMLPSEIHRLLSPIVNDEADYVTGSRFLPGGNRPNLPVFRRLAIPAVNIGVRMITGAAMTDATNGFRAYRLDLIRRAQFDWHAEWLNTYGYEYYLYAKVVLDKGVRWLEVPATMRYPPKGHRYSKIRPFTGWYEMTKPWLVARCDGKGFGDPLTGT